MRLSIKQYAILFVLFIIILVFIFSYQVNSNIESTRDKISSSQKASAVIELEHAITLTLENIKQSANKLSLWEEVRQQIESPELFAYWYSVRLKKAAFDLQGHAIDLMIYDVNGRALAKLDNNVMPHELQEKNIDSISFSIINNSDIVYVLPIRDSQQSIIGYLGSQIQFLPLLKTLSNFQFIELDTLQLHTVGPDLLFDIFGADQFSYGLRMSKEMLALEAQIQEIITKLAFTIIISTMLLYVVLVIIVGMPMKGIADYIDKLRANPESITGYNYHGLFQVSELKTIYDSLTRYHTELSKNEKHLSLTLNSIGDAVITTDAEGYVVSMNPVAEQLTGWSSIDAEGQSVKSVFPIVNVSTGDIVENPIEKVLVTGETIHLSDHTKLVSRTGEKYYISDSAAPICDRENDIQGMVLVFNDVTEQYLLRELASKGKRDMQSIMDHTPAVIFVKTIDGKYAFINKSCEKLLGKKKDEVIGKTDYEIFPQEFADKFTCDDQKVFKEGRVIESEESVPHNEGVCTYFTVKFPMFNEVDEIYSICGISTDITERKRNDEVMHGIAVGVSAQVGEEFFQSLAMRLAEIFSAKYVLIGLLDKHNESSVNTMALCVDGNIVDNMTYELKGTPCDLVINGKDSAVRSYARNVQELFPNDTMLVDMNVHSYIGSPLIGANGEHIGLIIVMDNKPMESTEQVESVLQIFAVRAAAELERVEIEESLQKKSQLLVDAQRISHIGSWEWDLLNNEMNWSDEMCCVLGLCSNECNATYENFINIIHPDDQERVRQAYTDSVKNKTHYNINYRLIMQDGSIKDVCGRCETFYDDEGTPVRSNGTLQDITSQVIMEETIRRAQKMDALGKLTGGVAHDYNNMLGVIMGYAEILERGLNEDPKLASYAHAIHHAGERGARLTKKLLSFSRKDESDVEKLNLNSLLKDQQHMLEKTLTVSIKLVLDLEEDLWSIWVNDNDMEDAILNLSINAMHAMEGKGQLTIQTRNRKISHDDAQLLNLTPGDYILFSITDTGIGMDEEMMHKIFEPFFTTKGEQGTGLGLSQVYGFVQRSHGVLKVYSEPDHGSQFVLYFPRYHENGHDEKVIDDLFVADATSSATILVVDDERALRDLTCEILEQKGFTVISAESAENALAVLEHESVDLMISDIIMPEVDGYQLASIVMQKYPSIKIQLVSGFTDERNLSIIDEILRQNLLYKPFSSKALLQRIHELLD